MQSGVELGSLIALGDWTLGIAPPEIGDAEILIFDTNPLHSIIYSIIFEEYIISKKLDRVECSFKENSLYWQVILKRCSIAVDIWVPRESGIKPTNYEKYLFDILLL